MREIGRAVALSNTILRSALGIGSANLKLASVNLGWWALASRSGIAKTTSFALTIKGSDKIDTSGVGSTRVGQAVIDVTDTFGSRVANESRGTSTQCLMVDNTALSISSASSRRGTWILTFAFIAPFICGAIGMTAATGFHAANAGSGPFITGLAKTYGPMSGGLANGV